VKELVPDDTIRDKPLVKIIGKIREGKEEKSK